MTLRPDRPRFGVCYRRNSKRRELRGGPSRGGNRQPGSRKRPRTNWRGGEAAPATPLTVPEPEFLLELLIVAFDAPPELGQLDQTLEADVLRQGREPVLG